eukprot:c46516_g1_i1 orf=1-225(-)
MVLRVMVLGVRRLKFEKGLHKLWILCTVKPLENYKRYLSAVAPLSSYNSLMLHILSAASFVSLKMPLLLLCQSLR